MKLRKLEVVFNPLPGESLTRFITESLGSYVVAATGQADWYPLGFFLRGGDGEWLGGLLGSLWGGWLHVTHLWVAGPARRHGNGARLLRSAERYAVERGCRASYLDTHSDAARRFYEKLGYQVFASLDDFPPGHAKYFLRKELIEQGPP
jgi:GNAT superfamily N-acetyltransferase